MAAMGCLREGGVDVAAALVVADRLGCDPTAAPELVMAVNEGWWTGWRKRQDGGPAQDPTPEEEA